MGIVHSIQLTFEEVEELQKEFPQFSQKEIKKLYKRFLNIDRFHHGSIGTEEFLRIPEISMNPLKDRLIVIFGYDSLINFRQFVRNLSYFHVNTPENEKIKFLFSIYDIDEKEEITVENIEVVLKMMTGEHMTDDQIHRIALNFMESECTNKENLVLNFNDFKRLCQHRGIENKMSIDFL